MIKKILLLLDPSSTGASARAYACQLAEKHKAHLTALAVLDTPWITAAQPEPLGGSVFKIQRDEELIKQSHENIRQLIDVFQNEVKGRSFPFSVVEGEGFPSVVIEHLAQEHDLVVMGQTTDIHFDLDQDSDLVAKHVARDNPRPLILVPKEPHASEEWVVTAQDGSHEASRALHLFLLLGLGAGKKIEIVTIHQDIEAARHIAQRAVHLCESYGLEAHVFADDKTNHITEIIAERISERAASMVCMSGFSHTALRDALFGSTTKKVMAQSHVPLFLFH